MGRYQCLVANLWFFVWCLCVIRKRFNPGIQLIFASVRRHKEQESEQWRWMIMMSFVDCLLLVGKPFCVLLIFWIYFVRSFYSIKCLGWISFSLNILSIQENIKDIGAFSLKWNIKLKLEILFDGEICAYQIYCYFKFVYNLYVRKENKIKNVNESRACCLSCFA